MALTNTPKIGLGTWKSSTKEAYESVRYAIQAGYQHIDCAPIYMNEKPVGQAIKDAIANQEARREHLWITSKLWNSFHAYHDAIYALKETLHFMQLDYLDSFLIHWPVAMKKSLGYRRAKSGDDFISLDSITLEETWQALIECKKLGLTKSIGVSNFSITKIQDIMNKTGIKPHTNQIECHPLLSQNNMLEFCKEHSINITAYAPLGSKDRPQALKADNEPSLLDHPTITSIATEQQAECAQILLAWNLQRNLTVIPKSSRPHHIKNNLNAGKIKLSTQQMERINQLNKNFRFIDGRFYEKEGSPYSRQSIWD